MQWIDYIEYMIWEFKYGSFFSIQFWNFEKDERSLHIEKRGSVSRPRFFFYLLSLSAVWLTVVQQSWWLCAGDPEEAEQEAPQCRRPGPARLINSIHCSQAVWQVLRAEPPAPLPQNHHHLLTLQPKSCQFYWDSCAPPTPPHSLPHFIPASSWEPSDRGSGLLWLKLNACG